MGTEAVLTSTHNLCFGAKIRKIGIPLQTPVLLYKMGFKGVYITRTCFRDARTGVSSVFGQYENLYLKENSSLVE